MFVRPFVVIAGASPSLAILIAGLRGFTVVFLAVLCSGVGGFLAFLSTVPIGGFIGLLFFLFLGVLAGGVVGIAASRRLNRPSQKQPLMSEQPLKHPEPDVREVQDMDCHYSVSR